MKSLSVVRWCFSQGNELTQPPTADDARLNAEGDNDERRLSLPGMYGAERNL